MKEYVRIERFFMDNFQFNIVENHVSFRICYAYIFVDEMVVDSGIVFSDYFHERIHMLFVDETFQIGLDFI